MNGVIDFRVRLPADLRPPENPGPEYTQQYDAVLGTNLTRERTLADLREDMAMCNVAHAVVHAEYEFGDSADALNEAVGRLVADDSHTFSGFGTVSLQPLRVRRALNQVDRVCQLGLVGINIQPSFFGLPMDDAMLFPLYAKCEELGLPVATHTGVNYTTSFPIENDHPLQLDKVACAFPDLVLIACHAGWPWTTELAAVMRKHPNVFADFGGLAPRYVRESDTGWSAFFRLLNSLLAGQVLFATDWPVFPMQRALDEWDASGLKEEVLAKLLSDNARIVLHRAQTESRERAPATPLGQIPVGLDG
ncbi:MAG: amidohydrolase family protein [Acidimicrobiales bacterium]